MNIEFYKLAGLLAFVISWFGMLLVVYSQGNKKSWSISMHAAASKKTIRLLAYLSPISMGLYMIFVVKWVAPTFNLPLAFIVLNVLADTGYILAAWIPYTEGIRAKIHNILAYGASLLAMPIPYILAISPHIATIPRLINAVAFLMMFGILGFLYWYKPAWNHYLHYQIIYFLAFNVSLLAAGYLS